MHSLTTKLLLATDGFGYAAPAQHGARPFAQDRLGAVCRARLAGVSRARAQWLPQLYIWNAFLPDTRLRSLTERLPVLNQTGTREAGLRINSRHVPL